MGGVLQQAALQKLPAVQGALHRFLSMLCLTKQVVSAPEFLQVCRIPDDEACASC